jgi:hypothetical protein
LKRSGSCFIIAEELKCANRFTSYVKNDAVDAAEFALPLMCGLTDKISLL